SIASSTYDSSTCYLVVTGTDFEQKTGGANDITVNKLTITGEGAGGSAYTLTSGTNVERTDSTHFTVTLTGTDKLRVDALLNKTNTVSDDGTTYNLAAADDFVANFTAGNTADATATVTVSNYVNPAITSATYDASTGALVVTGTRMSSVNGATNDVIANTVTLSATTGDSYTLTDTANVDVTSETAFTLTLSATDKQNVNGILNKDLQNADDGKLYNIAVADNWMAGGAANIDIKDLTVNGVTVSSSANPAIASVAYNGGTGVLTVTGTNFVNKVGASDFDATTLTLKGEGTNTHTLTAGSGEINSATEFIVTLSAADKLVVNGLLNINGTVADDTSTTYNLDTADNYMVAAATSQNIADATTGVTVSNTQVPTITDATYDASTKALVVTGTNFARKFGASDISASLLSVVGEGSGEYTLTDTADVEVTSETEFTLTLSDTDKLSVNGLLNKDSTQADDTVVYNLKGAENWMQGAGTSATIVDAGVNAIDVSNQADPTVGASTYDYTTGVLAVTGTRFVKLIGSNNDVDLTKLFLTGEASGTRSLTTTNVDITDETNFSVTLNAGDKTAVNALLFTNGTQSADSVVYSLNAAENWMVAAAPNNNIADVSNAITVSNAPSPSIASSTYDSSTGDLVVTGTDFEAKSGGANDITVNKLTITGEGAGSAAYTLTSGTNVERDSSTQFTVTLTGVDKLRVDALLNKTNTVSDDGTTYNLAAADDFVANFTAGNTADATATVTVSNYVNPTITSATYDASTGALVVTGANMSSINGATNDVIANTVTLSATTGDSYTLTDTAN
ncbi:MAG: hypothetical protein MJK04_24775, partial [Psychrosphaera sp.]|nr:hypothetical protein [Psychrosphaera sp.]